MRNDFLARLIGRQFGISKVLCDHAIQDFPLRAIMKSRVLSALSVLIFVAFASLVWAQQPAQVPAPQQSQPSSVDTHGIKNYLLGPGDVLDVRIFGQPDLNSIADVDSVGNISSLPFLEPIRAKCRTEQEVQKDIAVAYARLLKDPQVSVRIVERKSRQPATVSGAVQRQNQITMIRKVRLNEIMAASGGFTERASGTIQIVHTEPLMCPQPGEEAEAAPIDGSRIPLEIVKIADLKAGKPEGNPFIRPGDYVIVTEAEPVYITGSVLNPQGIYARDQLTLSLALAMVGGVRKEAKVSEVRIHRLKPNSTERETISVDLAAIKKSKKADVLLRPFDWVEVPEAGPLTASRFKSTVLDVFTGAARSVLIPKL
jgi:polysaccharide export outer membrane protein